MVAYFCGRKLSLSHIPRRSPRPYSRSSNMSTQAQKVLEKFWTVSPADKSPRRIGTAHKNRRGVVVDFYPAVMDPLNADSVTACFRPAAAAATMLSAGSATLTPGVLTVPLTRIIEEVPIPTAGPRPSAVDPWLEGIPVQRWPELVRIPFMNGGKVEFDGVTIELPLQSPIQLPPEDTELRALLAAKQDVPLERVGVTRYLSAFRKELRDVRGYLQRVVEDTDTLLITDVAKVRRIQETLERYCDEQRLALLHPHWCQLEEALAGQILFQLRVVIPKKRPE